MRCHPRQAVFFALSLAWLLAPGPPARGQDRGTGIGLILGEPTGVSLKTWTGRRTAIDAAAAWSFERDGSMHLHMDYLIHDFNLLRTRSGRLPVYYGIGGRLRLEDKTRVGVRIPIGLCYIFENAPFDIFIELGPILDLAPATEFTVSGFIGFRYYL